MSGDATAQMQAPQGDPKPDLKALIDADRRERVAACQAAIQEALQRYRCRLDVAMILRQGQVPQVQAQVMAEE